MTASPRPDRHARLRRIEQLDLEQDFGEITRLFSADFQSAFLPMLLQGFLFTFAAPRMSRILSATRQSEHHTGKRAVDTALLTAAVLENGLGRGAGRDAARRVNAMHRRYDIHPQDFVVVGVDSALGQIRLAEAYGWRAVTDKEREAVRLHFAQLTRAYGGPREFPGSWEAMETFWDDYAREQFSFEPQNKSMSLAVLDWYSAQAPWPFRRLFRGMLIGLVDPRVLAAVGLPEPARLQRALAQAAMRLIGRRDPVPDGGPDLLGRLAKSVYPGGFTMDMLGTHPDEAKHPPAGCPHHAMSSAEQA